MSTISANEAKPSWHEELCYSATADVLDFDVYQCADALLEQVKEPEGLGWQAWSSI